MTGNGVIVVIVCRWVEPEIVTGNGVATVANSISTLEKDPRVICAP